MRPLVLFLAGLCFLHPTLQAADHPVPAVQDTETKEQRDARTAWWHEARFGMFIHWGIYSIPAGTWHGKTVDWGSEWIMERAKIPVAEYQALAARFNPTKFDADAWVAVAKAAGMKYIVITAKHHDGFAMFKSSANPFNIVDATPFRRDPLKELAAACQKQGMKLGFYYSQDQDWTAPGAAAMFGHWDKAQEGNFAAYLKTKAIPQMEELLGNYQPAPAIVWFDTPTNDITPELASQIVTLLNKHPRLIWNNRLGGGYKGDTETPEQNIPPQGYPGRDWETCMTINESWGYKADDTHFKSTETLLRNLIDIASKGGNYLLNVGPDATGTMPPQEVERLKEIGQWLGKNGQAIYGTTGSPFHQQLSWGRATQAPGKLYLHVFKWPTDGKLTVPITNPITKAYLLARPQNSLVTSTDTNGVNVMLPSAAPDPMASVIVLEISGAPVPLSLTQDNKGVLTLKADAAEIKGDTLKLQGDGLQNLGFWFNANDFAHWEVSITKPGTFKVSMEYALDPSCAGSAVTLSAGDQKLTSTPAVTGSWANYQDVQIGTITVSKAGPFDLKLTGAENGTKAVINFRKLVLTPQ